MSDAMSDDEVDDVREALENARLKLYEVKEQKDRKIAELEFNLLKTKDSLEATHAQKMAELENHYLNKVTTLTTELDRLRNAFEGDSSGWEERITGNGMTVYQNKTSGETSFDEPEVLRVAKIIRKAEQVDTLIEENKSMKSKFKDLEVKKREAELLVNKLKTEVSLLRKSETSWKEASKNIAGNLQIVKNMFDMQCDQVLNGLDIISKVDKKIQRNVPFFEAVSIRLSELNDKCESQVSEINKCNAVIRDLQSEIQDKSARIGQLSLGVGEELEILMKPMRDRLAESMVALMKEKANRAEERRELADLWPDGHLMPTVLMKSRSLSDDERSRRLLITQENNVRRALSIEIRAKVAEAKLWEIKYDDYGRPYYEHVKTGEVQWEEPEIRRYVPPSGYDTSGNIVESYQDVMANWKTLSNSKGEVYFQNIETGEITFKSPYSYKKEPRGKSPDILAAEAAQMVLGYIKQKIAAHVENMKALKQADSIVLNPEERRLKEKEDRIRARLGLNPDSSLPSTPSNQFNPSSPKEGSKEDLSSYHYDIETVEMMAWSLDEQFRRTSGAQKEQIIKSKRDFLNDTDIRSYEQDSYVGPSLYETDTSLLSIKQIRAIVEYYSTMDDKLDAKISKVRQNIKDFSYILMEKLREQENAERMASNQEEPSTESKEPETANQKEPVVISSAKFLENAKESMKQVLEKRQRSRNAMNKPGLSNTSSSKFSDVKTDTTSVLQDSTSDTVSDGEHDNEVDANSYLDECYIKTYGSVLYPQTISIDDSISDDVIKSCSNIVNFTLFCGYTNTDIDNLPESCFQHSPTHPGEPQEEVHQKDDEWLTSSYFFSISKATVDKICKITAPEFNPAYGLRATNPLQSSTFMPQHRSLYGKNESEEDYSSEELKTNDIENPYNNVEPNTLKDIFGEKGSKVILNRPQTTINNPWTSLTKEQYSKFLLNHEVWKSRQFAADILRYQLQQKAVQSLINGSVHFSSTSGNELRSKPHSQQLISSNSRNPKHNERFVNVALNHICIRDIAWSQWVNEDSYYVQCTLGNWKSRTSPANYQIGELEIQWGKNHLNSNNNNSVERTVVPIACATIPYHRLINEYILVEVYSLREHSSDVLVGSTRFSFNDAVSHIGSIVNIENDIYVDTNPVCTGKISLSVSVSNIQPPPQITSDPEGKLLTRVIKTGDLSNTTYIKSQYSSELKEDRLAGVYPLLSSEKLSFASLFNDFNSTDGKLFRLIAGDISADDLLSQGYRINENISTQSVLKSLPNFLHAKRYLKNKYSIHTQQTEKLIRDINIKYPEVEASYKAKMAIASKRFNESKKKHNQYQTNASKIQDEINRLLDRIRVVKVEKPRPKEPILKEILPAALVPAIPNVASSREDKSRPLLTTAQMTDLVLSISNGGMDGKDWFTVFGTRRANPKQVKLLTTEIQSRNEYLETKRNQDIQEQQRIIDAYNDEVAFYEKEEKQRKLEYGKLRKDCRKTYLKLDVCNECIKQISEELSAIEIDIKSFEDVISLHEKSMARYQVIRTKQLLERERQCHVQKSLKQRLVQLMNNRRQVLNSPISTTSWANNADPLTAIESNTVTNDDLRDEQFQRLCIKAEEVLRSLEYEVIDIKENLLNEGVNLRQLQMEELSTCQKEYSRLLFLTDLIEHRSCVDTVLERSQYEILHLFESKEKILMIEAEKDDVGKDCIDTEGLRYVAGKVWDCSEMVACMRLINLMKNKIGLINSINKTGGSLQKNLIEAISVKWKEDYLPVRDSWVENSDYVRSQNLLRDIICFTKNEKLKLENLEKDIYSEKMELASQVSSLQQDLDRQKAIHASEVESMAATAAATIKLFQNKLDVLKSESSAKQTILEESIAELSRECQKIREQLTNQTLVFEDKNKILAAMVSTQQDAVQHLTAKLENIIDEREKIIIKSKLDYDRLRTQIRNERKYSANLLFLIHGQKGAIQYYRNYIDSLINTSKERELILQRDKQSLRQDIFHIIYSISRLSTDPNELFEFFAARLANLCGSRKVTNDILAQNNNAVAVLAALCRSPRPLIRKYASRALGSIGWNGFVEDRVLAWDARMHWKMFQSKAVHMGQMSEEYKSSLEAYKTSGNYDVIIDAQKNTTAEEYSGELKDSMTRDEKFSLATGISPKNANVRTIIKQRRQYALRATRRIEGPNAVNQRLINISSGAIPSLVQLCIQDGDHDWEIPRNAALAICIASYEPQNHREMTENRECADLLVKLCQNSDPEVQTHAAVTIANLCHNDDRAQHIFGQDYPTISILLSICSQSTIIDLLEACTAALANITCYSDSNCQTVIEGGGIPVIIAVIKSCYTENLLDLDQNDEIQSNAAELLANVSRYHTDESVKYFDIEVMNSLVFMCASRNIQVKRHAPLVIGNISQSERCREEFGKLGGIEALFLALEDIPQELPLHGVISKTENDELASDWRLNWQPDPTVQANVLWALCNLMWHPANQERAGRFMSDIVGLIQSQNLETTSKQLPVQIYAYTLLANVLYYNNTNRIRFLECEGAIETLMNRIVNSSEAVDILILESSLRALLSLSYLDYVCTWLVITNNYMPQLLKFISRPFLSKDVVRFALSTISNISVSYENRKVLFANGGLEILIDLSLDDDSSIIHLSHEVVQRLEDVMTPEQAAMTKDQIGLKNMIELASNDDPLVRATAAESIGEEIWHNKHKQKEAISFGGLDALLSILRANMEPVESVLPALWSMRNLLHNNPDAQHHFFMKDGMSVLVSILSRCLEDTFDDQVGKVAEAALASIATSIINHTGNSRRLLVVGLQQLLDISDGKVVDGVSSVIDVSMQMKVKEALSSDTVISLAKAILLMLGPYNYVICRNCSKKQELSGTNCVSCGHRLRVDLGSDKKRGLEDSSPSRKELRPMALSRPMTSVAVDKKRDVKSRKVGKGLPSKSLTFSASNTGLQENSAV